MMAKSNSKPAAKFFVAEDFRQELAGKFSLIGVVPAERFAVGGPAPVVPAGLPPIAFIIPSLAFVFVVTGISGTPPGRLRIMAPDGMSSVGDISLLPAAPIQPNAPFVSVSIARPFTGPTFGGYSVHLEIGSHRWKFPLVVERLPEVSGSSTKTRRTKGRGKK